MKDCPNANRNNAPAHSAPRAPVAGVRRGGNQLAKQSQNNGRGCVNHIDVQEALEAPEVILGEFPINSTLVTVLFDSGASHSFVSSNFVSLHKLPTVS